MGDLKDLIDLKNLSAALLGFVLHGIHKLYRHVDVLHEHVKQLKKDSEDQEQRIRKLEA